MLRLSGLSSPVRRALKWDSISAGVGGLSAGALFPFLAVIARRDLGASAYLIALLGASFSVGNFFSPLMAHFIRGRPKLRYVILPQMVSRSFFLLMPLAVTAPRFVGICLFAAAIGSLSGPAYAAVIRDAYPVERRGFLMGIVRVLFVGGAILGALVGGALLARVSYRWVFPALAVVGILAVGAFSRIGVVAAPGAGAGDRPAVPPLRGGVLPVGLREPADQPGHPDPPG
jgi:MFS family permease